jgi:hypothetical protein
MWERNEAISHWPMQNYPQDVLDSVPQEKAEEKARFPFEMREWTEKRGDKLKD